MDGRKEGREGGREEKEEKKPKYFCHLCPLKGPRSCDTQVAMSKLGTQIWDGVGKEQDEIAGSALFKKKQN